MKQLKNIESSKKRGNPNFSYSQEQLEIYSTIGGYPPLDGDYTVFGEMLDGYNVMETISGTPVKANPNNPSELSVPTKDIIIMRVEVLEADTSNAQP